MSSTTAAKSKMTALKSCGRSRVGLTPHQKYLKRQREDEASEAREKRASEMEALFNRYDADLVEFKAGRLSMEAANVILAKIRAEKVVIQQVIDKRLAEFAAHAKAKDIEDEEGGADEPPKKKKKKKASLAK
jgi:hypothetical protein